MFNFTHLFPQHIKSNQTNHTKLRQAKLGKNFEIFAKLNFPTREKFPFPVKNWKNGKFRSRKISNLSSEPTVKFLPSTYHNIGRVTGEHDPSLSNIRYNIKNIHKVKLPEFSA